MRTGSTKPRPTRVLVAMGAVLLLVIFLVSRSCVEQGKKIDQARAEAIARGQIDYRPDGVNVRFLRRGIEQKPFWAVSLWTLGPDGGKDRVTVVLVSAETGRVEQISRE